MSRWATLWAELRAVGRQSARLYENIFNKATVNVEFHDSMIHETDGIFYAVGCERGWLRCNAVELKLANSHEPDI